MAGEQSIYQRKELREHIFTIPDTYIGSVENIKKNQYVYDNKTDKIISAEINYNQGLYKIYDEILVNAADQYVRLSVDKSGKKLVKVTKIEVNINPAEGWISVYNNGSGIPTGIDPKEGIHHPELVFSVLLTSGNYNEKEEKIVGGRNGYGSKLTNIFSDKFIVETVDENRGEIYKQINEKNMTVINKPVIKPYKGEPFTRITFYPTLSRFGITSGKIPRGIVELMKRRVYDMAGLIGDNVAIYLDGEKISTGKPGKMSTFLKYAHYYVGDSPVIYNRFNDRYEIVVGSNPDEDGLRQISFVNNIYTADGGTHLNIFLDKFIRGLIEIVLKKNKELNKDAIKPQIVKDRLFIAINATIPNPSFNNQTKDSLNLPMSKFGYTIDIDEGFYKKAMKLDFIQSIIEAARAKSSKLLSKTDGKKTGKITGIPKLDDAHWAGTKKSGECTIILTEGDSAKALAVAGVGAIKNGSDMYGVFPLRGKLLNVREATPKQLAENKEINEIKQILGLENGRVYTDLSQIRYSHIMIMCDSDVDGYHIKGLIMNLFDTFWPSLLKLMDSSGKLPFVYSFLTPIVKAKKGKESRSFYSLSEFEKWNKSAAGKGWDIKYYKGLGTSTSAEAKEYFTNMKLAKYHYDELAAAKLKLAFDKKEADNRKLWLSHYIHDDVLDADQQDVNISTFIDKELIHFSNSDNIRSIPNIMDGLKPSQRKILFAAFKRKLVKEIKVAQFSGYVAENSDYHHGEVSLQGAIIAMAQNYVGSNNINLLYPAGQFGTRLENGKDSASPRYIFTRLTDITRYIYRIEDDPILKYQIDEDGTGKIEPEFYIPIIPMILVNGTTGIGTGYSTDIPMYNPIDIIRCIKNKINGSDECRELIPYYRGYIGKITKNATNKYTCYGAYDKIKANILRVYELPIGMSITAFKENVEKLIMDKDNKLIRDYKKYGDEHTIHFEIEFYDGELDKLLTGNSMDPISKLLGLTSSLSTTNMHLYNNRFEIKKYATANKIIDEFYECRLPWYSIRKRYILDELNREIIRLDARVRFILDIIEARLDVRNMPKKDIDAYLEKEKYPKLGGGDDNSDDNDKGNYTYLTSMPIYNLTREKKDELIKMRDEKTMERDILAAKSPAQLWNADLDELDAAYKTFLKN
jgi:DNA topoisomerase-2